MTLKDKEKRNYRNDKGDDFRIKYVISDFVKNSEFFLKSAEI